MKAKVAPKKFRMKVYDTNYEFSFERYMYSDDSLAIQVLCKDLEEENPYWEPFSTLTVWVCPVFTTDRCAYIDTNNNPKELITKLEDMGIMSKTGYTTHSGYCDYPEYEFDAEWLESIR